ncbi:MAG: FtsX-like permease family protein [Cytophagales bacterium]|nr:FtsX-like permease family protein [Cytophagales bacterium]
MNDQPPKLFRNFFRWFCHPRLFQPIEGDLMELYHERIETLGKGKADLLFIKDVLVLFRKDIIKPADGTYRLNFYGMLKHNLLISIRSFRKFKSTFLINLLGLATGLASALLIFLWVTDELNTDKFSEQDSDRHVQVIYSYPTSGTYHTNANGSGPNPLYAALVEHLPEVEYAVPVTAHVRKSVFSAGDNNMRASYRYIGEGYFNIFPGEFIHGDKSQALSDKSHVIISDQVAINLFGSSDRAMGKTIELKDEYEGGSFQVNGIFKPNSLASEKVDILLSYEVFATPEMMEWYNGGTQANLVLHAGTDLAQFNGKLRDFLKKVWENSNFILYAQPYSEKYLYGQYENGLPTEGRIVYVRLFSIIALFVLTIACINYMNFSTAKASRRIKEIGVKKAIGAGRRSLIFQYFSESLFMAFLALIMALVIVILLLPQFNEITGKQLSLSFAPNAIWSILAITTATGLISGIYPALHLSGFTPVTALKGKLNGYAGGLLLRKGLVIVQFMISVTMIISVIVIYNQVNFIQTTNLGYNKDHIITFPKEGRLAEDSQAFFDEIRSISGVLIASQMDGELPGRLAYTHGYKWEGMSEADRKLRFYQIRGGYDLIKLLDIGLLDGRDFSQKFPSDVDAYILNETAIKMTGLEAPLDQQIGNLNPNVNPKQIIGVVKDFHFQSMQEEIKPFIFSLKQNAEKFIVKMQAGTEQETIARIEQVYNEFNAGYPFEYKFLDDNYQALYASEARITALSKYFAAIAIVISCLGLLALTSFSTQQRHKEIAIRKVLGSSNLGIIKLLSSDFTILVIVGVMMAVPIAYYLMRNWLDAFVYRIELSPVYFLFGGFLVLLLALLTITTQTANSAKVNVTESLRTDG